MDEKIVRPDRRRPEHRQDRLAALSDAVDGDSWGERRTHCWDLDVNCTEERRKRCAAHFVRRNCWDLWAAEYFPPGRKPCCHSDLDCSQCSVAAAKFGGPVSVYLAVPAHRSSSNSPAASERPAVYCRYLYSVKDASAVRSDGEGKPTFRCQRRRGIQLDSSYVSEVCGTSDHRECTFYAAE